MGRALTEDAVAALERMQPPLEPGSEGKQCSPRHTTLINSIIEGLLWSVRRGSPLTVTVTGCHLP